MHLTHIFLLLVLLVAVIHHVSWGNGVPPPKSEGERRSSAFPHSLSIAWLQYGVAALSGNDQSLCFSLRLCFSNRVCSTPNSWRTRN